MTALNIHRTCERKCGLSRRQETFPISDAWTLPTIMSSGTLQGEKDVRMQGCQDAVLAGQAPQK